MSEPAVILRSVGSQAPPPAPKSRKKEMVYGGLAATGLLMLVLTFHWFILSRSRIVTDNAYVDTEMMPVHSRIMGYLKEVPVSENESVKKGQVLAQIDDTDLNVELSFKQAKFNKASADEGRGRKLIRSNAISAADLENAEANLIAMKADLEGTLLKLQYTKIVSQTDGVIAKKGAQPGQFVQPGQNLFVIVPDHLIWVKANYKETQLSRIAAGQEVEIEADAYPGELFRGKVEGIYPSSGAKLSLLPPENASGNFTKIVQRIPVKISIEPKTGFILRPGMSVKTTVIVK